MTNTIETPVTSKVSITETKPFGSFDGTYRDLAKKAYAGCINYFGATPEQAHQLGVSLMSDWGNHLRKAREVALASGEVSGKYGKEGKDGEITLKSVQEIEASGKSTDAIRIGLIIQNLDKVQKGLVHLSMKAQLVETLHVKLFGEPAKKA